MVRGAAVAGVPSREVVEELGLVDGDVVRVEEELANYCVSCNRVAPLAAVCCVCSGGMCGHYTQIVWRSTQKLGCGIKVCTKNSPFGASFPTWTYVVCNYQPPGNIIGQKPY